MRDIHLRSNELNECYSEQSNTDGKRGCGALQSVLEPLMQIGGVSVVASHTTATHTHNPNVVRPRTGAPGTCLWYCTALGILGFWRRKSPLS